MTKNANQYNKIKHIKIRYHFLKDHYEKDNIVINYVPADMQLADTLLNHLILMDFYTFMVNKNYVYWIIKFRCMFSICPSSNPQ